MTMEQAVQRALEHQRKTGRAFAAFLEHGHWFIASERSVVGIMGTDEEPSNVVWSDELSVVCGKVP